MVNHCMTLLLLTYTTGGQVTEGLSSDDGSAGEKGVGVLHFDDE